MLELKTPEDCRKLPGLKNEEVKVVGTISIPDGLYLKGLENVKISGGTLTGFPAYFEDCVNFTIEKCGLRLKRPTKINMPGWDKLNPVPYDRYEKWWGPRVYSTKELGCRNITFDSCSISGNTDEWAIHPDLATWQIGRWAGSGLKIYNCLIGPSLINYSRGTHNFGLSIGQWDNFLVEKCVFYGHNRRCPQVQGNGSIIGCAVYGYGSMAVGIHCGSNVKLQDIYGRHSKVWPAGQPNGTAKLVSAVGGTLTSEYGKTPACTIEFSNVNDLTRAWKDRQSIDMMDKISGRAVPTTFKAAPKPIKYTEQQILSGIGCGDNFDKWVLGRIKKTDYTWIKETQ
jgi:hypothetical protein